MGEQDLAEVLLQALKRKMVGRRKILVSAYN